MSSKLSCGGRQNWHHVIHKLVIGLATLGCAFYALMIAQAQPQCPGSAVSLIKEYRAIELGSASDSYIENALNELASSGWEPFRFFSQTFLVSRVKVAETPRVQMIYKVLKAGKPEQLEKQLNHWASHNYHYAGQIIGNIILRRLPPETTSKSAYLVTRLPDRLFSDARNRLKQIEETIHQKAQESYELRATIESHPSTFIDWIGMLFERKPDSQAQAFRSMEYKLITIDSLSDYVRLADREMQMNELAAAGFQVKDDIDAPWLLMARANSPNPSPKITYRLVDVLLHKNLQKRVTSLMAEGFTYRMPWGSTRGAVMERLETNSACPKAQYLFLSAKRKKTLTREINEAAIQGWQPIGWQAFGFIDVILSRTP